jgi:hypothetical protein
MIIKGEVKNDKNKADAETKVSIINSICFIDNSVIIDYI